MVTMVCGDHGLWFDFLRIEYQGGCFVALEEL
jgi:hypothetical protein